MSSCSPIQKKEVDLIIFPSGHVWCHNERGCFKFFFVDFVCFSDLCHSEIHSLWLNCSGGNIWHMISTSDGKMYKTEYRTIRTLENSIFNEDKQAIGGGSPRTQPSWWWQQESHNRQPRAALHHRSAWLCTFSHPGQNRQDFQGQGQNWTAPHWDVEISKNDNWLQKEWQSWAFTDGKTTEWEPQNWPLVANPVFFNWP